MLEPLEARVAVRTPRPERLPDPAIAAAGHPADWVARLGGAVGQWLARLEDPARMLCLARTELDNQLMAVNRKLRRAHRVLVEAEAAAQADAAAERKWQDKASIALAHGRDDLARQAVAQGLRASEREAATRDAVAKVAPHAERLAADAARLRVAIGEAWSRQRTPSGRFVDATQAPADCAIDAILLSLKAALPSRA